jgi:hypothetical protein
MKQKLRIYEEFMSKKNVFVQGIDIKHSASDLIPNGWPEVLF